MSNTDKRKNIEFFLIAIAVIIALLVIVYSAPKKGSVKVIDCTWSEISPDFTAEMKQACRQLRAENFNKDLRKPK